MFPINSSLYSIFQKINFFIGRNPKTKSSKDWVEFIPKPFKSVLLISADFELAWAWRYSKHDPDPISYALHKAKLERENIPAILNICEQFKVPITWMTVGHLFLESCSKTSGLAHNNIPRVQNSEENRWNTNGKDWFEHDPSSNFKKDPAWYSPDLIKMILDSSVNHEIGCHTFSHIDCRDEVCPPDLIRSELRECKKSAERMGVALKSFVHPGYTIGNLDVIADEGFTNFRTDYENILGYPKAHSNGLWEFRQTAELAFNKNWSLDYQISRYKSIIKGSIKSNTVCVFWFHPSFDPITVEKIFPEVFTFLWENRDLIWTTTHNEYVNWLTNNGPNK
jgi:peptidoglycan/xylan/chitin deacetylase (PgdA/CDA1 family)